ncbi:MAG TPA: hypothetical protein VIP09_15160 [Dehalococcoidia bacterium]|jgi:hypothetical protein
MNKRRDDPLELKYDADAVIERAADRLRALLEDAVARLDPFPPFPGAFFSYGIEIEAPGMESPERGCIVLGEDGAFYELKMGNDVPAYDLEFADPVAMREEKLEPLELHPREYIVYAHAAITRVAEILLEREADA